MRARITPPGPTGPHHPHTHRCPPPAAAPSRTAFVAPTKAALMTIPLQKPQGHKHRRSRASVSSHSFPRDPHPTPQHPQGRDATAPYRTKDDQPDGSKDPGAKPGHPAAEHAAATPRSPHSDHPTQECATVCRARGSTTRTLTTQRRRCSHRASHTPHNSALTRPSLHESHHRHRLHTPTDNTRNLPSSGKRRTYNLHEPHVPRHRAGPGATEGGQATGVPRPRPRRRYPETPRTQTPHDAPSTSPLD